MDPKHDDLELKISYNCKIVNHELVFEPTHLKHMLVELDHLPK